MPGNCQYFFSICFFSIKLSVCRLGMAFDNNNRPAEGWWCVTNRQASIPLKVWIRYSDGERAGTKFRIPWSLQQKSLSDLPLGPGPEAEPMPNVGSKKGMHRIRTVTRNKGWKATRLLFMGIWKASVRDLNPVDSGEDAAQNLAGWLFCCNKSGALKMKDD